jgi:hypothetical protein
MGNKEVYDAVKSIFGAYGKFIKDVADEIGWEKTLEIYAKTGEREASQIIQFIKTHESDTRLNEWAEEYPRFFNSYGWKMDACATHDYVEYTIHRCPCFDGFFMAGLSREEINRLCKANHAAQDHLIKKELPGASFTSAVKPSKEEPCREKYTIPV